MTTTADRLPRHGSHGRRRTWEVIVPQYSKRGVLAVWAAAALPMGALAWVAAPRLADSLSGPAPLGQALLICLTTGLFWQFLLVLALVRREQGTLRWPVVREALWLRAPRSPRTGRSGGRVWWVVLPLVVLFGLHDLLPTVPHDLDRDFGEFLGSSEGEAFLQGAWGWFGLIVAGFFLNTMLGEELLFRGFLLPRMNGAFGDRDWLANGLLFSAYHLHVPWAMPATLVDTFTQAYPTKRYRSAWIGIVVHSAQSVFLTVAVLVLVL
jgi:membrane protease YdiL (CAAX protease family)